MGTLAYFGLECLTVFMVCICTTLSLRLKSENASTYIHFEFIKKSIKFYILQTTKKQGYRSQQQY